MIIEFFQMFSAKMFEFCNKMLLKTHQIYLCFLQTVKLLQVRKGSARGTLVVEKEYWGFEFNRI